MTNVRQGVARRLRDDAGATLTNDHVLRELIGPVAFTADAASSDHELVVPTDWNRHNLNVDAFVQDERNARVPQAVSARRCLTR